MAVIYSIAPALLGIVVVLQAGMNRRIAQAWGLPSAVLLNAGVFAVLAAGLFLFAWTRAESMAGVFRVRIDPSAFAPWFLIPGSLGLLLVIGGPWAISRFGAVHTFTLLISAQLLASLGWDRWIEGVAISPLRVLGVVVTWIGVLIAVRG